MAKKPGPASSRQLSRGLVIALAVVVALAGFNISIPAGKSAASNWDFAFSHPTILLHIVVAAIVLAVACAALAGAIRQGERPWIALSIAGLAFVLLAFISGVDYVDSLRKGALNYMSIGWLGAVISYATGWYLGRRKEHREQSPT